MVVELELVELLEELLEVLELVVVGNPDVVVLLELVELEEVLLEVEVDVDVLEELLVEVEVLLEVEDVVLVEVLVVVKKLVSVYCLKSPLQVDLVLQELLSNPFISLNEALLFTSQSQLFVVE